jgi:hypothetical protein
LLFIVTVDRPGRDRFSNTKVPGLYDNALPGARSQPVETSYTWNIGHGHELMTLRCTYRYRDVGTVGIAGTTGGTTPKYLDDLADFFEP